MDPKHPVPSSFLGISTESWSPDVQTPAQPSPEPWTPDNKLFSSFWGYSSPALDPIQQAATPSTVTLSLPSTPSTAPSLTPSSPDCMQHYTIPASAMDTLDLDPAPASSSRLSSDKRKKIPRPPNAFMIFRSWLIHDGKLPPEVERRQQNISKIAGRAWRLLDEAEKNVWRKKAFERFEDHKKNFPGYKFEPSPKNCRTGLERIRKAVENSDDDTARRLKALSDIYARSNRAVKLSASRRPRRECTSPYKLPTTPCTPQEGFKAPRLVTGSQLGAPSTSSIAFDSPSSSSVQPLSPLPLHTQPHAFTQEMPQQPLSYTFLPPGLPNHFQQAHQQENGTVVFPDGYAPVNPFAPPPGWYTFDHTEIVPPANTGGMMTDTASNTVAAMLGLYELNPPYAHFNPNLGAGGDGFLTHQQASPVPPAAKETPLSTTPLTPKEQEVFSAILGNSQWPFTLDDLIPTPLPFPGNGFVTSSPSEPFLSSPSHFPTDPASSKELSFVEPQANQIEGPISAIPQLPAANQCA